MAIYIQYQGRTKKQVQVNVTEARIEAMCARWEDLSELANNSSIRPMVSSIECSHYSTACLSCATDLELEFSGYR